MSVIIQLLFTRKTTWGRWRCK